MKTMLLAAAAALALQTQAISPTVTLDYATYSGVPSANGVTSWKGMRYAKSPIGERRFAAPEYPSMERDVQKAKRFGKLCIGTDEAPTDTKGEDCLFINVYAPSNASNTSKLPVYFFVQGGGFNANTNPNYDGTQLIDASGGNIVVVGFNYRVGLYGFAASNEIQRRASLNNGLKDQRLALQWVQRNIAKFGGNPKHVVLAGASAGAASVTFHLAAYGGRDDKLFQATAAESQSFAPVFTVSESQYQYDNLLRQTNCAGQSDTLACLRAQNTTYLTEVAKNIPYSGAKAPPNYMWNPVIDGDFVRDLTYRAFLEGKFVKVPAIWGGATNEGTIFSTRNINTPQESSDYLKDQYPDLNQTSLDLIAVYYPKAEQFPDSGAYWRQVSNAYGDLRYTCPGYVLNQAYSGNGVPSWNFRWDVLDGPDNAAGFGVRHTIEVNAIWGPGQGGTGGGPDSYKAPNGNNKDIVPVAQGYWTSFIRSFDPNRYRAAGSPTWDQWPVSGGYNRLRFVTNATAMESVPEDSRRNCRFFDSIAVAIKQ